MHVSSHAKTVWVRKLTNSSRLLPSVFISGICILLILIGLYEQVGLGCSEQYKKDRELNVAGKTIDLEQADSYDTRQQGLSGRMCIKSTQGMLFVFNNTESGDNCFWMKDMKFPIDIIWLNADKKVVKVEPNVQPNSFPGIYCPNQPTSYVLELKSGGAANNGIKKDEQLQF